MGAGAVAPQTASLDVGNRGSGSLAFSVSSDAPWLSVGATSGVAPTTLTLTAHPAGFNEGVSMDANVILTANTNPVQRITVPVRLAVGNTFIVGNATPVVIPDNIHRDGFE